MAFETTADQSDFEARADRIEELCAQIDRLTWTLLDAQSPLAHRLRKNAKDIELAVADLRALAQKGGRQS